MMNRIWWRWFNLTHRGRFRMRGRFRKAMGDPVILLGLDRDDASPVSVGLYATVEDAHYAVRNLPSAFYSVMTPKLGASLARRDIPRHPLMKR